MRSLLEGSRVEYGGLDFVYGDQLDHDVRCQSLSADELAAKEIIRATEIYYKVRSIGSLCWHLRLVLLGCICGHRTLRP